MCVQVWLWWKEDILTNDPYITASPNPVPLSGDLGTTTISWSTGDTGRGVVTVQANHEDISIFARGEDGETQVAWIQPGIIYTFSLCSEDTPEQVLGSVAVTAARESPPLSESRLSGQPFITANPNPIPYTTDLGSTTIKWSTDVLGWGELTVFTPDGAEISFASGYEGIAEVNWIQPGLLYVFTLHAVDSGRRVRLKSITVMVATSRRDRVLDVAVVLGAATTGFALLAAAMKLAVRLVRSPLRQHRWALRFPHMSP